MADDIIEQISPHIREILRIVRDVRGRRLRELNELVGQTSKLESFIFQYVKALAGVSWSLSDWYSYLPTDTIGNHVDAWRQECLIDRLVL